MHLYSGPFLTIKLENNNRFVQYWDKSPQKILDFKNELLVYIDLFKQYKPSQTLWLQENFTFELTESEHDWIEENINIPAIQCGDITIAFVVSKNLLAHIRLIDSFEEVNSILEPKHFASEKEARDWLDNKSVVIKNNAKTEAIFEGVDDKGNSIIKINTPSSDITSTIKSFKNLLEKSDFTKAKIVKYNLLTKREKEVLNFSGKGLKHQEIADVLHVSLYTVRTHWRNVKKKLEIKSFSEVIQYVTAFKTV